MDYKGIIEYVRMREEYIRRNKTNDVFCAGCLQATEKGDTSECCGKEILSKEKALARVEEIVKIVKEKRDGRTS